MNEDLRVGFSSSTTTSSRWLIPTSGTHAQESTVKVHVAVVYAARTAKV